MLKADRWRLGLSPRGDGVAERLGQSFLAGRGVGGIPETLPSSTEPMVPTILIVDADPAVKFQMAPALRRWGYRAIEAHTAAEAMVRIGGESVDLILLATTLPDGSGSDLQRKLDEACGDREVPVIVLAYDNESALHVDQLPAKATAYLRKPVLLSELRTRAQSVLHRGYDFAGRQGK